VADAPAAFGDTAPELRGGASSAAARRAFEPERAFAEAAEDFCIDDFFEREIGILCEQGNFERARVLLSRRASELRGEANLFYDGIRIERSAAPGGEAWQAWVARALADGAQIAPRLRALVPEPALRAYLVRADVGWTVLQRQKDAAAARELLRLRLEHQVDADPGAALGALEDAALLRAAQHDPALMRLAIAVLAGASWREPARASALAQQYGVTLDAGSAASAANGAAQGAYDAHALLVQALRRHGAWATVAQQEPCPAPLDRFVRVGRLLSAARAQALCATLGADLRVRPREYLRCATAIVSAPHGLADWLLAALQSMPDCAANGAAPVPDRGAERSADRALAARAALFDRLHAAARAVAADPLQRLWLAAAIATATALALGWLAAGPVALVLAPAVLLLWPLRRRVDAVLYRRNLRASWLAAVVTEGATIAEVVECMRALPNRALVRLAAHAQRDMALALVAEMARVGRAGAGQERAPT
jgi:hypothetical protein